MEKKLTFIDRLKARFFKPAPKAEWANSAIHSAKQKKVQLEAIDHSVSNKKILDLIG